jgi:hypothetical protein
MDTLSSITDQLVTQNPPVPGILSFQLYASLTRNYALHLDVLSHNPLTWSESDVITWLNLCNLEQYVPIFQGIVILGLFTIKFIK